MLYGAEDIFRNFFGVTHHPEKIRPFEFWAVVDISFDLKPGESLAIIGSNGSGKSTLLKLLNGILMPDKGQIFINGRVAALIEIGAGFHPMLTGRENVFINGQVLGMSRRTIREKFHEIVEFAEMGDFIDTPVKYYSSGMYVRLGFSIAVHAATDILLVDEVLAVGDLAFAVKCMKKMVEYRENGGTLILVTHGMHNVKNQCEKALWIEKGVLKKYGPSIDVANAYEEFILDPDDEEGGQVIVMDDAVEITEVQFDPILEQGQKFQMEIALNLKRKVVKPIFMIHLHSNRDESLLFSHYSHYDGFEWDFVEGSLTLSIMTDPVPVKQGRYKLSIHISEKQMNNHLLWHQKKYTLTIRNPKELYGILDVNPTYKISAN